MSKFTDDMGAAFNIHNAYEVSRRYNCPVIWWHTRHAHAFGHHDYRTEISFPWDGGWRKKEFRRVSYSGTKPSDRRAAYLAAAIEWAAGRGLGVEEWAPTGYPDTWMPKAAKEKMAADLKGWRKEQGAAVKGGVE